MEIVGFWVVVKPLCLQARLCLCLSVELERYSALEISQLLLHAGVSFCLDGALELLCDKLV